MNKTLKNIVNAGIVGLALLGSANCVTVKPQRKECKPVVTVGYNLQEKVIHSDVVCDGTVFQTFDETYDAQGNKIRHTFKQGNRIHSESTWKYDAQGNLVEKTKDKDGDGKVDIRKILEYDSQGRKIKEIHYTNGDGEPDKIRVYSFGYDAQGNLIQTTKSNGKGNLLKRTRDIDKDGKLEEKVYYGYDEGPELGGRLIRETSDRDGDGCNDEIHYLYYETNGELGWNPTDYPRCIYNFKKSQENREGE